MDGTPRQIDADAARRHLDAALDGHEQKFETFFLARFLGLGFAYFPEEAADADKEMCQVSFEVTEMLKNPQGSLHGGVLCSAMDISMGHLVAKVHGAGATIEMKVQFMRPLISGRVTCEGRFLRRGRTMSFMESRAFDAAGKLSGLATATWKM